jgi:DNA-directed RNA polymerase
LIDAFVYSEQARREADSSAAAVARYRKAAAKMDPTDLPTGQRLLVETVRPIAAVLEKIRDGIMGSTGGKPAGWQNAFIAFDPDVLAVIAIGPALRVWSIHKSRVGVPLTAYGRAVSSALRDQADYDRFVLQQVQAQSEATRPVKKQIRKAEEAGKKDDVRALSKVLSEIREDAMLRSFKRMNPKADRRAWSRFAARIEGARSKQWDDATRTQVGARLAACLVEGAPKWFELLRHGEGPEHRRPICLCLTAHALEQLEDIETRTELAHPQCLPMLVPPNPWRYAETQKEAA